MEEDISLLVLIDIWANKDVYQINPFRGIMWPSNNTLQHFTRAQDDEVMEGGTNKEHKSLWSINLVTGTEIMQMAKWCLK